MPAIKNAKVVVLRCHLRFRLWKMVQDKGFFLLPGLYHPVETGGQQLVQNSLELWSRRITHGLEVSTRGLGSGLAQVGHIKGNTLLDLVFSGDGHEVEEPNVGESFQEPVELGTAQA